MVRLALAKTLWGVNGADDPSQWDSIFERIKADGFEAVEAITLMWRKDTKAFRELLDKHGLSLICQIHTSGGDVDPKTGEYLYCTSNKLHEHLASFMKLTAEAAALKPVLINSHSGHDSWGSGDKAVAFFKQALKVEKAMGVPIVHETHRQRLLYSPYSTAELLAKPELSELKINADLSHWCCVCEHVFDAGSPRDDFWPGTLAAVARHCHFIHCRVGHAEGPQVNEPDAPEHAADVNAHFSWWRTIWEAQVKRVGAESDAVLWSEPEFGPPPYLQTLPYTSQPVADLWDVNKRIAARARIEFASALKAASTPEEAAAAAGGEAAAPKQVWVPQLGGGYVLKDAPGGGGGGAGGSAAAGGTGLEGMSKLGGSLLDLATKDAVKEEREKVATHCSRRPTAPSLGRLPTSASSPAASRPAPLPVASPRPSPRPSPFASARLATARGKLTLPSIGSRDGRSSHSRRSTPRSSARRASTRASCRLCQALHGRPSSLNHPKVTWNYSHWR